MIYCLENNYLNKSLGETGREPDIFIKPDSALFNAQSIYPFKKFDDYSLFLSIDLVLKINKDGHQINVANADEYYEEITVGASFTALDVHDELNGIPVSWEQAKGWDQSTIIGQWFSKKDYSNIRDINFCSYCNREMLHMASSENLELDFRAIISLISNKYPLKKGDLIFTGNMGMAKIEEGDAIELFLEDDSVLEFEIQ